MKEISAGLRPWKPFPSALAPSPPCRKTLRRGAEPHSLVGAYAASFLAGGAVCRLSGAAQGAFDPGSAIATNDAGLADLPLRILY